MTNCVIVIIITVIKNSNNNILLKKRILDCPKVPLCETGFEPGASEFPTYLPIPKPYVKGNEKAIFQLQLLIRYVNQWDLKIVNLIIFQTFVYK